MRFGVVIIAVEDTVCRLVNFPYRVAVSMQDVNAKVDENRDLYNAENA